MCERHRRCYGLQYRQAAGLLRYSYPLKHQYLLHCTFYVPPNVYLHGFQRFSLPIPSPGVSNERTVVVQPA